MSWFKKARQLVELPHDSSIYQNLTVEKQLEYIAQKATEYFYYGLNSELPLKPFYYSDPYDTSEDIYKRERKAEVRVVRNLGSTMPIVSAFDPASKTLLVCPHNMPKRYRKRIKTRADFYNILKSIIQHELTHVVDPKLQTKNPFNVIEKAKQLNKKRIDKTIPEKQYLYEYHSFYPEFNSYCREIIEVLRNIIIKNPEIKDKLKIWLGNEVKEVPDYLMFAYNIIQNWYDHDKINRKTTKKDNQEYLKIFKIRAYNELFKNKEERRYNEGNQSSI